MLSPRWPAVILFLLSMAVFLGLSRWIYRHFSHLTAQPSSGVTKSFAMLIVGLAALYVLSTNPFSLLFFIPLLLWFLIQEGSRLRNALNIVLFILGGLMVYVLLYVMGFAIQRINFAVLWYVLMMFSIGEIRILTALVITAIIAAGLTMIARLPAKAATRP